MSKNGLILLTPTSIEYAGTSATINANGSVSFSACTSLSLNGIFTADYDNYMVVWGGTAGAGINIYLRFRQSGFDNPNSTHVAQGLYTSNTLVSADRRTSTNGYWFFAGSATRNGGVGQIYGPYLAQPTAHRTVTVSSEADARTMEAAGTESSSTQWDGFTMALSSSTFTGRIAVYGMRK